MLRRITFGMLMLASVAVLALAVYLFWNARPWDYLLAVRPASDLDARSQVLSDRITVYNGQVEDLGRMVAVLMVIASLYVVAFAVSTHLYAETYQRLCREALASTREDFAQAAGDLREIRDEAARAVERAAVDCGRVEELIRAAQQALAAAETVPQQPQQLPQPGPIERARAKYNEAVMASRFGNLNGAEELLSQALDLSAASADLHAEIDYELACVLARRGPQAFDRAMEHLTRAFATCTPCLDRRISQDIDEGGALYQLASQPPYDHRINDLLLNVSVV